MLSRNLLKSQLKFETKPANYYRYVLMCYFSEKSLNFYSVWGLTLCHLFNSDILRFFAFFETLCTVHIYKQNHGDIRNKHANVSTLHRHIAPAQFQSKSKTSAEYSSNIFNVLFSCCEMKKLNWKSINGQMPACLIPILVFILFSIAFDYYYQMRATGEFQVPYWWFHSISNLSRHTVYVTMGQRFGY